MVNTKLTRKAMIRKTQEEILVTPTKYEKVGIIEKIIN